MGKRSLGFKLVFGGILIVFIPLAVVGLLSVMNASESLTKMSKEQAAQTAKNLADMTELVLEEEVKIAQLQAGRNVVINTVAKISTAGMDASAAEIEMLNRGLANAVREIGQQYEGIIVADINGKVFADSDNGKHKGMDISGRPYFQITKTTGQPSISDPVVSMISGKYIAPVCVPIKEGGGRLFGVLLTLPKIDFFTEAITSTKIGTTGYPFIANPAGLLIVHPNKDFILQVDISKIPEMNAIYKALGTIKKGVETYRFKGIDKIAGFAPVGITGWSLVVTQDEAEFLAPVHGIRNMILIVAGISFLLVGLIVWYFARGITRPITHVVERINAGADEVASAASQVSAASQTLAEGASEQAAGIEEASSSLEEMAAMTKQNADNARQADTLMKETNHVIGQANASMGALRNSMQEISAASQETSKIVKTIDEIAFQTNLLALNAAVEAARAGEAGAGFAVVADEVRNLAMRASEAAKNTSNLIEGTVKKVKDGAELTSKTNQAFDQVSASTSKVAELLAEISAASSEQAVGIEQVNKAVSEMDKVTQQNAAGAEETSSAAEELNAQAAEMRGMLGELATMVEGSGKTPAPPSHQSGTPRKPLKAAVKKLAPKARAPRQTNNPMAEAVIPLNDEKSFSDF
jgi:methyl-accepting chemotaxis protein